MVYLSLFQVPCFRRFFFYFLVIIRILWQCLSKASVLNFINILSLWIKTIESGKNDSRTFALIMVVTRGLFSEFEFPLSSLPSIDFFCLNCYVSFFCLHCAVHLECVVLATSVHLVRDRPFHLQHCPVVTLLSNVHNIDLFYSTLCSVDPSIYNMECWPFYLHILVLLVHVHSKLSILLSRLRSGDQSFYNAQW